MANALSKTGPRKEKVTVSLDAILLRTIDAHVEQSKGETSRSAVIEQALHLWKQQMRDIADAEYYLENADALKRDGESWSEITAEAAKKTWD